LTEEEEDPVTVVAEEVDNDIETPIEEVGAVESAAMTEESLLRRREREEEEEEGGGGGGGGGGAAITLSKKSPSVSWVDMDADAGLDEDERDDEANDDHIFRPSNVPRAWMREENNYLLTLEASHGGCTIRMEPENGITKNQ
jgi:hypothetical protein